MTSSRTWVAGLDVVVEDSRCNKGLKRLNGRLILLLSSFWIVLGELEIVGVELGVRLRFNRLLKKKIISINQSKIDLD